MLDQLERVAAEWVRGRIPTEAEIDVVTRAVADLRRHLEAARDGLLEAGPEALGHLAHARERVAEAMAIVDRLSAESPARVPSVTRGRPDPRTDRP